MGLCRYVLKEDELIQVVNANTKLLHDNVVLNTTYSTGLCLSADLDANFDQAQIAEQKKQPEGQQSLVLCCPIIESIVMDSYLKCKKCNKKIKLNPGTGILSCDNCHREYLVKNLQNDENSNQSIVTFDLRTETTALTASAFGETIMEDFGENVLSCGENTQLKARILALQKVDFTITKSNMIITKIANHDKDDE